MKRLKTFGKTATFFFLPLLVLLWTSIGPVSALTLPLALVVLLVIIGLSFIKKDSLVFPKTILQTLFVLLLVGATGWFLSPFFFLLYLLPIYIGFLYVPMVAFGLLAALIIVFSFSIGEVDPAFDLMTLLSLLLVIPLVIYLRRQYLVIRQSTKDILILHEEGSGIHDIGTIDHLLSNRITKLGVTLRDPLTFLRQASQALQDTPHMPPQVCDLLERMRRTAAKALEEIRAFEGDASEHKVLTNSGKTVQMPANTNE